MAKMLSRIVLDGRKRIQFMMETFYVRQTITKTIDPNGVAMKIGVNGNASFECILTNKLRHVDDMLISEMDLINIGGLDANE